MASHEGSSSPQGTFLFFFVLTSSSFGREFDFLIIVYVIYKKLSGKFPSGYLLRFHIYELSISS